MQKAWLHVQGIMLIVSVNLCLFLNSCNSTKSNSKSEVTDEDVEDSIAYTLQYNSKLKTYKVEGSKMIILEVNEKVHIHQGSKD